MNEIDNLSVKYATKRPLYESFTLSLHRLISTLLDAKKIEYFAIEPRTKTTESFDNKIRREDKEGKYLNLHDITDLSGVRVISFLEENCTQTCKIIEENFSIDEKNSIRKESELDPDKFGYLSTHYVLSLKENRTSLPEFSQFKGLKAEVQVRTLLQHTWAAIDWKFRYKGKSDAPRQIQRRLFRISALLEAADSEFSIVSHEIEKIKEIYSKEISEGGLDIPINLDSFISFMAESNIVKTIISSARQNGIAAPSLYHKDTGFEKFSTTASIIGLTSIKDVNEQLIRIHDYNKFFESLVQNAKKFSGRSELVLVDIALIRYVLYFLAKENKRKTIHSRAPLAKGYTSAIENLSV